MERIRCTGYYVSCPRGYHCVKKMKGIPLQMANCFLVLVNVFAKAYRWRKCKKKKKMKLVHCVVFSSCWGNVNACDNVGKPGLLISRNKKKAPANGTIQSSSQFQRLFDVNT